MRIEHVRGTGGDFWEIRSRVGPSAATHPPRDSGVVPATGAPQQRPPAQAAHRTRTRGATAARDRQEQRRARRRALPRRRNDQDTRLPPARKARPARPRPSRRIRLENDVFGRREADSPRRFATTSRFAATFGYGNEPPCGRARSSSRTAPDMLSSQQHGADTKRTHQKRHARRLATHPRAAQIGPICRRNCVASDRACTRVTPRNLHGKECHEEGPPR